MPNAQPSLFARDDTMLGVCEALGEDLGINPMWLRLPLPLLLFIHPVATIVGYLAAGLIVLASRLLFPNPEPAEQAYSVSEPEALPANAPADRVPERLAA